MSTDAELFRVQNSDWTITETAPGIFDLTLTSTGAKIAGLPGALLVSALAVISELDRYLRAR
jgi:hypothetical protein